jgi:hypothetical protein
LKPALWLREQHVQLPDGRSMQTVVACSGNSLVIFQSMYRGVRVDQGDGAAAL